MADRRLVVTERGTRAQRELESDNAGNLHTVGSNPEALAELQTLNSLVPSVYDYIEMSYASDKLTGVVFKVGGSGGGTVSTLTLAYTGENLTSVTKS